MSDWQMLLEQIELGALSWPNGLELSADSIHRRLEDQGKLR
jgi:hypothetical protein